VAEHPVAADAGVTAVVTQTSEATKSEQATNVRVVMSDPLPSERALGSAG
jgi:hypothetical protein